MTVPPIVKPCITKNALPTTEQFDCEEQQAYFFQHNWEKYVTRFEHNDRYVHQKIINIVFFFQNHYSIN